MEFSSSDNNKILILSQEKAFHIFQEMGIPKKLILFSQNKAVLIFRETETLKNSLYFWKRSFLTFQKELPKPQKPTFNILLQSFIFYKLNQTILLVYKNIESFLLY